MSNPVEELLERLENPIYYMKDDGSFKSTAIKTDPQYALTVFAQALIQVEAEFESFKEEVWREMP